MDTTWGPEKCFLAADLTKAYDKVSHVAIAEASRLAKVPPGTIRWIVRFLKADTSILLAGNLVGKPFGLAVGIQQGDPLSPILFVFITAFIIFRIERPAIGRVTDQMWYVDDSMIRLPPSQIILRALLKEYTDFGKATNLHASMAKSEILAM